MCYTHTSKSVLFSNILVSIFNVLDILYGFQQLKKQFYPKAIIIIIYLNPLLIFYFILKSTTKKIRLFQTEVSLLSFNLIQFNF